MVEMDMDSRAKRALGPFVRLGLGNRLPDIYSAAGMVPRPRKCQFLF